MAIELNKVVTFHYRVSDAERGVIEDSHAGEPLVYLHGHGQMIRGVEDALTGKQAGEQCSVTLDPGRAYGLRQENSIQRISVNHVIGAGKKYARYAPGTVVQVNTKDGPRTVVVVKAGLKSVDVDTNHPLAGRTLTFDLEVVSVRDAAPEEIEHGHAHGAGGHQH